MKKRILSFLLSTIILFTTVSGMIVNINAFDIDESEAFMHYAAANMARILGNTNIYYAHFFGQDYNGEKSVENRLRVRSTSMLYQHFADIEKENDVKAVFADVWDVLSINTERFSGLTETDFYSGVLWAMMTGNFNLSSESVDSQMEDFENVANGMILEFAEWYCTSVAKEDATAKASEILKKWDIEDESLLEQVQIWYGDHYSTISEQVANEKSFFDSTDKIFEYSGYIIQFCGSALDYLTKMSQIEAIYGMSHVAYVDFLTEFVSDYTLDPQLLMAAENLLVLMTQDSYEEALDQYILDLVCQDGTEIVLDKLSDVLEEVGEKALEKVGSTTASSILLGVKLGMEAANLILGVEDKLAVRYNILLLDSMTDAVFNTAERLRQNYYPSLAYNFGEFAAGRTINAELSSLADAYVASIEMCYRFLLQTDVYVENYVNEQYNNWWNGFWGNDEEVYNTYMDVLESEIVGLQRSYRNTTTDAMELYEDFCEQLVNEIIYDADGWSNVPANQVKEFYVDVTLSSQIPTKTGCKFAGWYDSTNGGSYKPGATFSKNYSEDIILVPTWTEDNTGTTTLTAKRQAVVDRAYEWYNKTWTLEQALTLWHDPSVSNGITLPAGTVVRGIPYTQISCKYTIDGTLPDSTNYFSLSNTNKYNVSVNHYCPGVGAKRTAPTYGAECVQLVYDAWYHGDSTIGKRDVDWSLIIGDNKTRGIVKEITWDKVQPGDALGISSHIRLVVGVNNNNTPSDYTDDSYEVIEQTTSYLGSNNNIGTTKATYTYSSLVAKGYVPYCYVNLDSDSGSSSTTTYTITYNANGGTSSPAPQTKAHGVPLELSNTIILRDGYVFKGWALTADAQEAEYSIGSTFNTDANTTLYAVWGTSSTSTAITLSGTIKDATVGGPNYGQSISGVKVEFFDKNGVSVCVGYTNSEGVYTVTFPSAGTYKAVLSKEGYNTFTVDTIIIVESTPSLGIWSLTEEANPNRDIIAEGYCREDLTWTLYDDGELVIDGTGEMFYYNYEPWREYRYNITKVTIGDSVTSIGDYAFSDCDLLTSVNISDSVTTIGARAFDDCTSLESVIIGDSVTGIGDYAFHGCDNLKSVYIKDIAAWCNIDFDGYCYANPLYYADELYLNGNLVVDLVIPDSVTSIGNSGFSGCSSITSVTIPDSVTSIGTAAFDDCYNLKRVFIEDIAAWCNIDFGGWYANPLYYADELYLNGNLVVDLVIPESVTSIGAYAFSEWDCLASVIIGDSVTSIGDYAFCWCRGLKSVTLGDSVTSIGEGAFRDCYYLASVNIPDSVTTIGAYAFSECDCLASVYIPDNVTSIGEGAFYRCSALTDIMVSANNDMFSNDEFGVLYNKSKTTLIQYPTGSTRISYNIPDNVTSIGEGAFCDCHYLVSVNIPDSVTTIGDYAFLWSDLKKATVYSRNAEFGLNVFGGVPSNFELYSYAGSTAQAYANDNGHAFFSLDERVLIASGECGDNLTWERYSDGELVIAGTGEMWEFDIFSPAPWDQSTWDQYRDHIDEVIICDGVTSIGDYAFSDCDLLTSVNISDSVTTIGARAFSRCDSLASVTMGDSVTTIGNQAFDSCDNLKSVYIKDIFAWCNIEFGNNNANPLSCAGKLYLNGTPVVDLVIPDSVITISGEAFRGCSSLVSVTIPDSVTSIGYAAFFGCTSLESVIMGDSVTNIGSDAFRNCTNLESVTISDSVTSIDSFAFQGCTSLVSIIIPNGVTTIDSQAFRDCTSLESASIYSRNAEFNWKVFDNVASNFILRGYTGSTAETYANNNGHTFVPLEERVLIASGVCGDNLIWALYDDGELVVDGTGDMTSSTWRSSHKSQIKTITISNGVASIGDLAFYLCDSLTNVDIPDSVTSIGNMAFSNCTNLTSVVIPHSVTSIGVRAFEECDSLTSITVDASNTKYSSDEYGVLFDKNKTTLIQYPIDNRQTEYSIPDSVTSIGSSAFYRCANLTSVDIPDSVTSIGYYAFEYCDSLTNVDIPDSVTSIGNMAFSNCTNLTSVIIPSSVTSIGSSAFKYCSSLTGLAISDGVINISEGAFSCCTSLTNVTIPSSVTSIGGSAFGACTSLTSVTIPTSVTSIGIEAFYYCTSLTSVTIPASVTSIGGGAFGDCTSLTKATVYSCDAKFGSSAFSGASSSFELHGYEGSTAETYASNNRHKFVTLEEEKLDISGTCGENLAWTLLENGELVISGTGDMPNYTFVSKIPWYKYRSQIKTVVIKNGVTTIGDCAFESCSSLESVIIPESVTSIGFTAFGDCVNLSSVEIPGSVTSIGLDAFIDCTGLKSIKVDASNKNYSSDESGILFDKNKTKLLMYPSGKTETEYSIPYGVTSFGFSTFSGCSKLSSVKIPNSVTIIDGYTFRNCSSLTNVEIPNSVTSIGREAFYGCHGLTSVEIPSSVTSIDDWAFSYCTSLTKAIVLSNNVVFGNEVFLDTSADFAIYGYVGSTAEAYAKATLIPFSYIVDGSSDDCILTVDDITLIPVGAKLRATKMDDSVLDEDMKAELEGQDYLLYDINLTTTAGNVQPNGEVEVRIKADSNASAADLRRYRVYRIGNDGNLTDMGATYVDGYFVFKTDHFSLYIAKPADIIVGDVNSDGIFDYYDVSKLFAFYRGKATLDGAIDTDINGDGTFDYYDVSKLFAIYRGKADFN